MTRIRSRSLFLAFALLSIPAYPQLVDIETLKLKNDSSTFAAMMGLAGEFQKTNKNLLLELEGSAVFQFQTKSRKNLFLLAGDYRTVKHDGQELIDSYYGHLRYIRRLNGTFGIESFAQYQSNRKLLMNHRVLAGAGVRAAVFRKKHCGLAAGASYMPEWEYLVPNPDTPVFTHRLSAYCAFDAALAKGLGGFSTVTYLQPDIRDFSDYRILNDTALSLSVYKGLSLALSITYAHDSFPPAGVDRDSFTTKVGIKYRID